MTGVHLADSLLQYSVYASQTIKNQTQIFHYMYSKYVIICVLFRSVWKKCKSI